MEWIKDEKYALYISYFCKKSKSNPHPHIAISISNFSLSDIIYYTCKNYKKGMPVFKKNSQVIVCFSSQGKKYHKI